MDVDELVHSGGRGRRIGTIDINWSDNRHAYGIIPVPVAVITGKPGPTALLVAGTHGDEYEGQLVIRRLIRELRPESITGRLIFVPALNLPAVQASARVSPIDGLNLNRSYPGEAGGSPTLQIANVVAEKLLPIADFALDLHSGGSGAFYLPSAYVYEGPTPERFRSKQDAAEVLGLPWSMRVIPRNGRRTFSGLAEELGTCVIATEIAGGGSVTPGLTDDVFYGLLRLLEAWGFLKASRELPAAQKTRWIQLDRDSTLYATRRGLFELAPSLRLGSTVSTGEAIGRIYSVDNIEEPPFDVVAPRGGVLGIVRRPPLVEPGDGLFSLMTEMVADASARP